MEGTQRACGGTWRACRGCVEGYGMVARCMGGVEDLIGAKGAKRA